MSDLFARDTEIALLLAAAVVLVMAIQLFLCFKAKKTIIKLLPTALLAVAAIVFYEVAITARDWTGFAYGMLAVCSVVLLFFSAVACVIFSIIRLVKRNGQKSSD